MSKLELLNPLGGRLGNWKDWINLTASTNAISLEQSLEVSWALQLVAL